MVAMLRTMPDNPLMTHTELINVTKTGEENIMSMRIETVVELAHKMLRNSPNISIALGIDKIAHGCDAVVELYDYDGEISLADWMADICSFDATVSTKLVKEALGVIGRWEMIPDVIEDFSGPGGCYGPRKINEDDPEY